MFISCEQVDSFYANMLIQRLRQDRVAVSHSPRNPSDDRWVNWYDGNGQTEISKAEVFVVVVTTGWDASTWMAFEATEALKFWRQGSIKRIMHYNPANTKIHYPENKYQWLGEKLPDNLEEAVTLLKLLS